VSAALNVAPAAGLGWAAWRLVARVYGDVASPGGLLRTAVAHLALALAFSGAWGLGVMLLLSVQQGVESGTWDLVVFRGPGLRWQALAGLAVYGAVAGTAVAVRAIGRAERAERDRARADAARTAAELHALRARLHPHFLFNALASATALVRRGDPVSAAAGADALERFAGLLRDVLRVEREGQDQRPLGEEWRFTTDYLAVEALRLGERLRVRQAIDEEALDAPLPVFAIQTLVENAVRHAVATRPEGGVIDVRATIEDDTESTEGAWLVVTVGDDGPGLGDDAAPATAQDASRAPGAEAIAPGTTSSGLGLSTLQDRLAVLYGPRASLALANRTTGGCLATLRIPLLGPPSGAAAPSLPPSSNAPPPLARWRLALGARLRVAEQREQAKRPDHPRTRASGGAEW
jgi:signal transduction histidine kinase